MKKEVIYIAVPVVLCLLGIIFKSLFLSDTLSDTQQILDISNDISAKFYKDSLVQDNVQTLKASFEKNIRGDIKKLAYGELITELLKTVENMLQKSGIEYKGNDINQDMDEVFNYKSGTSSLYINLTMTSSYSKIRNLIQMIEQSDHFINIEVIEIFRTKSTSDSKSQGSTGNKDTETDEYNVSTPVTMKARLEFVKFL